MPALYSLFIEAMYFPAMRAAKAVHVPVLIEELKSGLVAPFTDTIDRLSFLKLHRSPPPKIQKIFM